MTDQAQCPNCGGYKVHTEKKAPIVEVKSTPISLTKWLLPNSVVSVLWLLIGACVLFSVPDYSIAARAVVAIIAGIPFIILVIQIPSVIKKASEGRLATSKTRTIGTSYSLYCQLCGYRWTWDNRTPYPTATVRSDLIARGEQRLAEEQRKQQEDAAALYRLTHQDKK